jgi:hypothetical protein
VAADPQFLGGKLALQGARLLSPADIDEAFDHAFPRAALAEVLKVACKLTNSFHVAA